eukprot:7073017-Pyramimonas_sp.AAC.1
MGPRIGGAPYGAAKRCTGWCVTRAGGPTGTSGGAPCGATFDALYLVCGTPEGGPIGTFGGAPCGATKRCTGRGRRTQAVRLGPSVGLPVGHEALHWVCERKRAVIVGPSVDPLVGPRNAVLGVRGACGRSHLGRRLISLWCHEAL